MSIQYYRRSCSFQQNTLENYYTVRWDHAAKQGSNELKVKKGDEVIIITRPKEDDETGWYEVKILYRMICSCMIIIGSSLYSLVAIYNNTRKLKHKNNLHMLVA